MAAVVVGLDPVAGAQDSGLQVLASDPGDLQRCFPRWPFVRQGAHPVVFDRQRIGANVPAGLEGHLTQPVGAMSVWELRPGSHWLVLLWGLTVPTADAVGSLEPSLRAGLLEELALAMSTARSAPHPGVATIPLPESSFAMAWLSPAGAILAANRSLALLVGRDAAALERCSWQELTHPDDLGGELVKSTEMLSGLCPGYQLRKRFLCPAGQVRWADVAVSACRASDGTIRHLLLQAIDISEAEADRQRMTQALTQLRALMDHIPDLLVVVDPSFRLRWASPSAQAWLEAQPSGLLEALARQLQWPRSSSTQLVVLPTADGASCLYQVRSCVLADPEGLLLSLHDVDAVEGQLRDQQDALRCQAALLDSDDMPRLLAAPRRADPGDADRPVLEVRAIHRAACSALGQSPPELIGRRLQDLPLPDPDGAVAASGVVSFPHRDPLTGLFSRGVLFDRLDGLRNHCRRRQRDAVGLLLCDLDQLSMLNRRHGRACGDRVLRATARRFRQSTRDGDLVVRFGGDELLVVLQDVHQLEGAIRVAERIRQATQAPIQFREVEAVVQPSLSIGLTLLRDDEDLDEALFRADIAVHAAKASGGNQMIVMPAITSPPTVCIGTGVVRQRQRRTDADGS